MILNNKSVEKVIEECNQEIDYVMESMKKYNVKKLDRESNIFNRYILIYITGTIETSYKKLIYDFCFVNSDKLLHSYFDAMILNKSSNPSFDNICNSLGQIDKKLKSDFKSSMHNGDQNNAEIKSSLKSLVELRNSFAHGNPASPFSLLDVINYYNSACEMIILLDKVLYDHQNTSETTTV